jgi:hypothetical protein
MRIIETKIPDIEVENLYENKIDLANKVIQFISPLLDQVYIEKVNNYRNLKKEYLIKKQESLNEKNNLEIIIKDFEKKKKAKKLLDNFTKLFNLKVITLHTKNEIINILNSIDEINSDKIDFYIKESEKIITRRLNNPTSI